MKQKEMGKKYILGVDPGLSGALAILDPRNNSVIDVLDMPIKPSGVGNRNMVDSYKLFLTLDRYAQDIELAVIEDVHSNPGDGPVGAFSFGKSFGVAIGVISSFLIPIFFSPPQVWKSTYGLSSNKTESRVLAGKKYPKSKFLFERKKDDGRAEAVLLADFGKRFLKRE